MMNGSNPATRSFIEGVSNGWPHLLSSLKSLLETGHASTVTSREQARGARERAIALAESNGA